MKGCDAAHPGLSGSGLPPDDELPTRRAGVSRAGGCCSARPSGPALLLLQQLPPAATQGRAGTVIEIDALLALAVSEDAPVGTLAGALAVACPQGCARAIADGARR